MWIARIWYLLLLLAAAVGFAGVVDLPAHRDARVIEMTDRAADLSADLIRNAVAASRDAVRNAAKLAASAPRLHAALAEQDPPLPPDVRRGLVGQALTAHAAGGQEFVVVDGAGQLLGASKGVDAAAIAKDPAAKQAAGGTPVVRMRGQRWMAAVPLPKPARGAMITLSKGPVDVATQTHKQVQIDGKHSVIMVLFDGKVIAGGGNASMSEGEASMREAYVKFAKPDAATQVEGMRARKYAVSGAPGMQLILAWETDPPTQFKDTGGIVAVLTRGLQKMPEVAIFGALALLVWLLGVIVGNLRRAAVVRRVSAQVDLIAAGPEIEPIAMGDVPAWMRPLADSANESAASARHRMQSVMQSRIDQLSLAPSEVSAERPLNEPLPSKQMRAITESSAPKRRPKASSAPPLRDRSSAPRHMPDSSAPPARQAAPKRSFDAAPTMQDVGLGGDSSLPPPVGPPPDLDDSQDEPTINLRPSSVPPPRSPFADSEPPEASQEHSRGAEGTTELPSRRMGVFKAMPATSNPPAHLPPMASDPPADPPSPAEADETIDRRHHGLSSAPPPAIEDAELSTDGLESGVWDMSLPGLDAEPTSTLDSIELPRPTAGSLLDQLRAKNVLEPQNRGGDRTVVRPIPMALLDASTSSDSDRTAVGPAPTAPEGRDALERYYEQVFQEFLEIKRTCGEPTGGVQYRGFRAKLVRTRKSLMDRFNCVDVRFRVYVKDGRAALKAAPILDEA